MLYGKSRDPELAEFLHWLAATIRQQAIDVLIIAGDVFDHSLPSHRSQALYYRFLCEVVASNCRHVIVVAGNHDSPTLLNAPQELLKALNVYVIGQATADPCDEVLILRDAQQVPELIVCAVPYLRDRDLRRVTAGETLADKERKLIAGIADHYAAVADCAKQRQAALGGTVPIVATGHLFTAGGQTQAEDGVRSLYVGSLAQVGINSLPNCFDYLALGHLHVPQMVNGCPTIRYSGSPLPMSFREATQQKSLCCVDLNSTPTRVDLIPVPQFQPLEWIQGDWQHIRARLHELTCAESTAWLEIVYNGQDIIGDLRSQLEALVEPTAMQLLRIRDQRRLERVLAAVTAKETVAELTAEMVFERCLVAHEIPEHQHDALWHAYREIITALQEDDSRAQKLNADTSTSLHQS